MNQDQSTSGGDQEESSTEPSRAAQTPHLDHEGGSEPETQENGQEGVGLSDEGEEFNSGSHHQGEQGQGDEEHQSETQEPNTQAEPDQSASGGGQGESSNEPIRATQTPHLDYEGGSEPETKENGQEGVGLSEEEEEFNSGSHHQGEQSQKDEEHQSAEKSYTQVLIIKVSKVEEMKNIRVKHKN
ncbi:hypothetical protein F2Q69_00062961 [Brassica cretica]|uniref:Uncharacterized protein n=1 Tax=Brassica cretica TaxID=69181 RepID=A0A8S9RF87_BRACR|nr:hypothetical protein F2Q69_00062961 [Brassica cretica]